MPARFEAPVVQHFREPPLGEEELLAIESRANAATPGPWCHREQFIEAGNDSGQLLGVTMQRMEDGLDQLPGVDNAAFIAHARTDVPRLIAEIRRLQALVDEQQFADSLTNSDHA